MADDTPPRQMSLIPYPNDSREVVLYVHHRLLLHCFRLHYHNRRRGNAVVVLDPQSHQLSVREASDQALELTECPYCHRPYRDDVDEHGRSFNSDRPFVDPDYFGMLAASQRATPEGSGPSTPSRRLFIPALRSGRSRDVSGAATPPPAGAEFLGSAPAATSAEGISNTAFSHGYFKQFFHEQGELGRGGNGVVLLVEHVMDRVSLGQFACKRVPVGNDHSWLEKVLVEVKLLQVLRHKNLVAYHWVWLEDYQPNRFGPPIPCLWILQDYCNGGDLHTYVLGPKSEPESVETKKQRMRRRSKGDPELPQDLRGPSKLAFDEIFSFFRDITSGLHHLHTKGYVHRDLKPSNCLLQRDGGKTRALISDFGEVQVAGANRGSTGATGTISYCAPEVLQRETPDGTFGNFTTKSDIFSLGMIVYFMCFARLPYSNADDINEESEDLELLRGEITLWKGFDDRERRRADLPEKLYKFLKRLLSVDAGERPSTGEILVSIRTGASAEESEMAGFEESGVRVSSLDSPGGAQRPVQQGRKNSAYLSRPGLSSLSRQVSDDNVVRSRSPAKHRSGSGSQTHSHSRPTSPIEGSVVIRPRKLDIPPSAEDDERTPPQSPRLMLPPPPPERPRTDRLLRFARQPTTLNGFRAALFVVKLLTLFLPCTPYVTNGYLMYPLLGIAALDLGFLEFEVRRSVVLLVLHVVTVVLAERSGRLCEGKRMVWEEL